MKPFSSGMEFAYAMFNNVMAERGEKTHIQYISEYGAAYAKERGLPRRGHSRRTIERNMNRLAKAEEVQTDGKGWYWI